MSKDFKSFWSTWRNKMGKRYVAPNVVDECRHRVDIANVFAGKFAEACLVTLMGPSNQNAIKGVPDRLLKG